MFRRSAGSVMAASRLSRQKLCDETVSEMSTNKRHRWREEDMEAALRAREEGCGWQMAAKAFNVPQATLRRRFNQRKGYKQTSLGGQKPTFSHELERELVAHVQELESRFFGLTSKEIRTLAFQLAEKLNIKHQFNKNKNEAGQKWIRGFLKRNPTISLRRPENTSIARAQAFNKTNIQKYFEALTNVIHEFNISPEKIYNVDESGITTVQSKPQKVLATKGRKQVGAISSAERGQHLTVACCMNAFGNYIPPAFIFPRKRFKNELMDNAPPGSVPFCQEKGWMSTEIFLKWVQHFVRFAKPSIENKVLLLLDGHSSHKGLDVLEYTKNNGIILFCFPAHCTHRVQPLDVGFFGPLRTYYDQEVQTWMKQHPGRPLTHFQVAGIFSKAYMKAATTGNAVSAFSKTGISPLNPNVFEDWMFAPALTTERPATSKDKISTVTNDETQTHIGESEQLDEGTSASTIATILAEFSPIPVAETNNENPKRKKRKGKTGILNSTPEISTKKAEILLNMEDQRKKLARSVKRKIVQVLEEDGLETSAEAESGDESDAACIYCNDLFSRSRAREFWLKCQQCNKWCHAECAGVPARTKKFICELCI